MKRAEQTFLHGSPSDREILLLWNRGSDTKAIAKRLWTTEHHVANRLAGILHRARQQEHQDRWTDHTHTRSA